MTRNLEFIPYGFWAVLAGLYAVVSTLPAQSEDNANAKPAWLQSWWGGDEAAEAAASLAAHEEHVKRRAECKAVVFYATPHFGSPLIPSERVARALSATELVTDMHPDNPALVRLNQRFVDLVGGKESALFKEQHPYRYTSRRAPSRSSTTEQLDEADRALRTAPVRVLTLAETEPTHVIPGSADAAYYSRMLIGGVSRTDSSNIRCLDMRQLVVPLSSANPRTGRFVPLQGKDHKTVCKPASKADEGYRATMQVFCIKICAPAVYITIAAPAVYIWIAAPAVDEGYLATMQLLEDVFAQAAAEREATDSVGIARKVGIRIAAPAVYIRIAAPAVYKRIRERWATAWC